ncbi:TRAP transporter large permease subunit [Mesorhizobium sp. CAU 1732]|uniref:TRAP transporter large permease n=1 Tax=Mesorhizobium sp. CAU 1732 TaxID=3140358 RepID=UPI00326179CA
MYFEFTDYIAISMFVTFIGLIFTGYPVAWCLAGTAIFYTALSVAVGEWTTLVENSFYLIDWNYSASIVDRNWAVMENWVLISLPMFIFMGLFLDKSGVAHDLMVSFARLLAGVRGGLAISVALLGILLAASTGIIGASVVLLTLLGVPAMLKAGYDRSFAVGTVCAVGTLGILLPPSIMLVLMADRLAVSVGDLFMGAVIPGLMLGLIYVAYILIWSRFSSKAAPPPSDVSPLGLWDVIELLKSMLPPIFLILAVLGSIFLGVATPTEASGMGAAAAMALAAARGRLTWSILRDVSLSTMSTTGFIFALILAATAFSLVFRGLGGDELFERALEAVPLSPIGLVVAILAVTLLLGFVLDWLEITLIILPLVGPVVANMGFDLTWFAILFALTLQTSFITPPVGPAIFYAQGVAPKSITLPEFYRGAIPFVILQVIAVILVFRIPSLATYLPSIAY